MTNDPERPNWISKDIHRADGSLLATIHYRGLNPHPECGPYTYGWSVEFAADVSADEVEHFPNAVIDSIALSVLSKQKSFGKTHCELV